MNIVVLTGPSNVGKTTTLTIAYDELITLHANPTSGKTVLGNPFQKDFETTLDWMGKKIVFFTMGDYKSHLLNAIDRYSQLGFDVFVGACNSQFVTALCAISQRGTCHIIPKTIEAAEPMRDLVNRLNASMIVSHI